jgi:hypothetical protein
MDTQRTLVIGDLHAPYQHESAVDFLADIARREKPSRVVCIGDEIDAHALSRYDPDPDERSPGDELGLAVESLRPVYKLFPKVRVCESNHTWRPYRKAFAAGLPRRCLRPMRAILDAPAGWRWAPFHRLGEIMFCHGEGFGGPNAGLHAATRYRISTVIGHIHSYAGVAWVQGFADRLFGFMVGCLINPAARAFSYAKYSAHRPALGCGLIADGVPTWFPLKV